MLEIVKKRITLTKGDDGSVWLRPKYKDKSIYTVQEGDRAFFRISSTKSVVEIECNVNVDANKIVVSFVPNDTKDLAPGIYRYEAELITSWGMHYTFLADETFILGAEIEKHISNANANGNGNYGNNIPSVDGELEDEPVVDGDIQPTNPSLDYETLNHLPKINHNTLKGDMSNEQLGIPTKTSNLENDSDFVSDDDYQHTDNNYDDTAKNAVDALGTASTYDVPESGNASNSQVVKGDDSRLRDNRDPNPHTHSKADITDFPTNVSAFNNDSGFITNTVNNLANYYLKSETYTRAEVEQLIAAIKQGKFEIVAELPASGDANVIYLVPKSTAQTSNSYDEYVYINNAWEKIGDTDIDLSGYVTDDELTTALQSYLTTSAFNTAIASYYTKTETDNLLANKVDKVAGKGLSTNDYDNTAKGIVDGVTSALNDKVDKVQGKGLSTNDYDNTAKSIVDGVTSALADKVDKVNGKGLSTEDYTTAEKSKLGGISDNAKKVASSSTNGHIEIDDVDTTVYDDTAVQNAIENIEDELSTDYATVEGNPINFSTLSAQKSKSTIIDIEPIQDLHGYDKPWVGGAGKNLLPMTVEGIKSANSSVTWTGNSTVISGVTFTILTDGDENVTGIKANGTANDGNATLTLSATTFVQGNYYFNGGISSDLRSIARYNSAWYNSVGGTDTSIIISDSNEIKFYCSVTESKTANNAIYYPMFRLATVTDATFEPYTNIASISGRSEVDILGCGKNLLDNKLTSKTANNIICTVNSDKSVTLDTGSNTASANTFFTLTDPKILKAGTYTLNGLKTNSFSIFIRKDTISGEEITNARFDKSTFTLTKDTNIVIALRVNSSISVPNVTVYPQLEYGEKESPYSPYQESTSLQIQLGQTVYGGTLDVEKGVLVVDRKCKTLSGSDTPTAKSGTYQGSIIYNIGSVFSDADFTKSIKTNLLEFVGYDTSPNFKYGTCIAYNNTSFNFWIKDGAFVNDTEVANLLDSLGLQVCYYLANPITIQLTPNVISLIEGVNNISTTCDKITLTYRDGKVATLGDLTSAVDSLDSKIDESKILTDTVTGDKYILVVTNGVLSVEQISN